jgi:hypothetical protein
MGISVHFGTLLCDGLDSVTANREVDLPSQWTIAYPALAH